MYGKILFAIVLCLVLCVAIGAMTTDAHAQDSKQTKSFDKGAAGKKGVGASLASGDGEDDGEGPSKLQMGLGVGSIFVMIIVVKWL
jgi:hypothetical protein